jgi:uncharacterized coiled-coil DUF342 family protein
MEIKEKAKKLSKEIQQLKNEISEDQEKIAELVESYEGLLKEIEENEYSTNSVQGDLRLLDYGGEKL